jgi:N-succinyldiaminopimelate aminotransferase
VAAIPPTVFYDSKSLGKPLVRFAYCKKEATIAEAIERLGGLATK